MLPHGFYHVFGLLWQASAFRQSGAYGPPRRARYLSVFINAVQWRRLVLIPAAFGKQISHIAGYRASWTECPITPMRMPKGRKKGRNYGDKIR